MKKLPFCIFLPFSFAVSAIGAEPIFDGKSLDGWDDQKGRWFVEDQAITAEIKAGETLHENDFLFYKEALRDFELQLEFKITGDPSANSGIQIRSKNVNGHAVGLQADLDKGMTWLGRFYDEHARALIAERGNLTFIDKDGRFTVLPFQKNPGEFIKHVKQDDWNSYKIIAKGHRVEIHINAVLFSTLEDYQVGQFDPEGLIALQLHSGIGPVKLQFRNIYVKKLKTITSKPGKKGQGVVPKDFPNIGFEKGDLSGWKAKGDAFTGQPVKQGLLLTRMGIESNSDGEFWMGGYEVSKSDAAQGTLTSKPFEVTHDWAALRIGGGAAGVGLELIDADGDEILATLVGSNVETMSLKVVDLKAHRGKKIYLRIKDDSSGGWGHINYDDFRFYTNRPEPGEVVKRGSPLLWNLARNPNQEDKHEAAKNMQIPPGFEVNTVVSEPEIKQPISFEFDAKGRLWVAEAVDYPSKAKPGEGKDRLLILEDKDGDGHFESKKVFADKLNLVSGFAIGYGGVFISSAPEIYFIPDKNGDDVPDGPKQVLIEGFSLVDTHETPNSFMWGNDGWLYGCHGMFNPCWVGKPGAAQEDKVYIEASVWRLHPVTHEFQIYANGGSNQWGLSYNAVGDMFMTHCRSAWGLGPVTQVFRDGQYWSQINRNHEPYIATPPSGYAALSLAGNNFMTSIAAYGHGEGGAGKPGSRTIFGGHSHVGAMVYLGDNWPDEYRNNLFTLNLHGSQMNRELLTKQDSAWLSHSHGRDQLYSPDPEFLGVHLKYGPDGAVYFSDWADRQQCHNQNHAIWNRTNGRIFRMAWKETYRPVKVDLQNASSRELIDYLDHKNEWYSNIAQHVLRQRRVAGVDFSREITRLKEALLNPATDYRFRKLICLEAAGGLDDGMYRKLLQDSDENIVKQVIIFLTENESAMSPKFTEQLIDLAGNSSSATVRLHLALACISRIAEPHAKAIIKLLALKNEDANDRFIPKAIWYAYSKYAKGDVEEALMLAQETPMVSLRRSIFWSAAKEDLAKVMENALTLPEQDFLVVLEALSQVLVGKKPGEVKVPEQWEMLQARGLTMNKPEIKSYIDELGIKFGTKKITEANKVKLRIEAGRAIFKTCATCHMPDTAQVGPSLKEIAQVYDQKEDLIRWIKAPFKKRANFPQMPGFGHMEQKDLELVSEYILSLRENG